MSVLNTGWNETIGLSLDSTLHMLPPARRFSQSTTHEDELEIELGAADERVCAGRDRKDDRIRARLR